MEGAFFFSFA